MARSCFWQTFCIVLGGSSGPTPSPLAHWVFQWLAQNPKQKSLLALQAISLWHSDTFRVDASSQVKYTVNTLCFLKNSLSLHSCYKYKFIFSLFPAIEVYSNNRWRANSVSAYLEELWSSGKVSLTCMSSVRLCTRALNKELRPSFSYRSSLVYWKIHVQQKNVSVSWLARQIPHTSNPRRLQNFKFQIIQWNHSLWSFTYMYILVNICS